MGMCVYIYVWYFGGVPRGDLLQHGTMAPILTQGLLPDLWVWANGQDYRRIMRLITASS